jgi:hypothetical protein
MNKPRAKYQLEKKVVFFAENIARFSGESQHPGILTVTSGVCRQTFGDNNAGFTVLMNVV